MTSSFFQGLGRGKEWLSTSPWAGKDTPKWHDIKPQGNIAVEVHNTSSKRNNKIAGFKTQHKEKEKTLSRLQNQMQAYDQACLHTRVHYALHDIHAWNTT